MSIIAHLPSSKIRSWRIAGTCIVAIASPSHTVSSQLPSTSTYMKKEWILFSVYWISMNIAINKKQDCIFRSLSLLQLNWSVFYPTFPLTLLEPGYKYLSLESDESTWVLLHFFLFWYQVNTSQRRICPSLPLSQGLHPLQNDLCWHPTPNFLAYSLLCWTWYLLASSKHYGFNSSCSHCFESLISCADSLRIDRHKKAKEASHTMEDQFKTVIEGRGKRILQRIRNRTDISLFICFVLVAVVPVF